MTTVRIHLSDMPTILREIVTSVLSSEDDMVLVGHTFDTNELEEAVRRSGADVLIVGCDEAQLPQVGNKLLASRPCLKILGIDSDGRRSFLYQLEPHLHALGELSPELLKQIVRGAAVGTVNEGE